MTRQVRKYDPGPFLVIPDVRNEDVEAETWTDFTPQLDQGASTNVAKTTNWSKYQQTGSRVVWAFRFDVTGSGTAGSEITLTLPVTSAAGAGGIALALGTGLIADVSGGAGGRYVGMWLVSSDGAKIRLQITGNITAVGEAPSFALASGDDLHGTVTYEAA